MKKVLFAAAFVLLASVQSFAIVGVGGHYLMNLGSLKSGGVEQVSDNIKLEQKGSDGLAGFGLKLWVDILPFVDLEMTGNIAAARYDAFLDFSNGDNNKRIPLEVDLGVPFYGKAKPLFALMSGDLSVTYPFTMLPIIRPYIGAGISYMASTPVLNKSFVENFLSKSNSGDLTEDEISESIVNALEDEGLNMGFGGHAIAGFRLKAPVIPFALYANIKYYFGGNIDSKFSQGPAFELGGGFAL